MIKLVYYITAHGYGHGTRSCDILNAIHETAPDVSILVKTDLPIDFLNSRLPPKIKIVQGAFDVGLIQKDSIQIDLEASLVAVEEIYQREEELIEQEAAFIRSENIGVVVADIPAIPLAAAKRAGVPAIAVGNFGWDWIYSDFVRHDPRWQIYVEKFRNVYAQTDLLIRIPFAEPMAAFPNQLDVPLLAKAGTPSREQIAQQTKANIDKPWILLSFTSLNLNAQALENIAALDTYEFFTVDPLAWEDSGIHCIDRTQVCFADILASVDIVVTKPGFGIVSECIANDKPILYTDRENFLEYPILVESIERYCRNTFIHGTELYAGHLQRAIEAVNAAPPAKEILQRGGAQLAANAILKHLH